MSDVPLLFAIISQDYMSTRRPSQDQSSQNLSTRSLIYDQLCKMGYLNDADFTSSTSPSPSSISPCDNPKLNPELCFNYFVESWTQNVPLSHHLSRGGPCEISPLKFWVKCTTNCEEWTIWIVPWVSLTVVHFTSGYLSFEPTSLSCLNYLLTTFNFVSSCLHHCPTYTWLITVSLWHISLLIHTSITWFQLFLFYTHFMIHFILMYMYDNVLIHLHHTRSYGNTFTSSPRIHYV